MVSPINSGIFAPLLKLLGAGKQQSRWQRTNKKRFKRNIEGAFGKGDGLKIIRHFSRAEARYRDMWPSGGRLIRGRKARRQFEKKRAA